MTENLMGIEQAAGMDDAPWEYVCRLCGWEWRTVDGLWAHIPSHGLDQATYGTLVAAARERDTIRAAAQTALETLEYVWEMESRSTRIAETLAELRRALNALADVSDVDACVMRPADGRRLGR